MANEMRALIYSSRFEDFSYGEEHPFKIQRYRLTLDLIREFNLLEHPQVRLVECPLAPEEELLSFHRSDYLDILREFSEDGSPRANFRFGLGDVENPVFPRMYEWSRLGVGGSMEAVRQVVEDNVRVAFNLAGGYHHAHAARASGFSYLNDAVVAINWALRRGLRVAYVDIDAHHGDGVQEAFYETDRVLTISLHETGENFFPQTGFAHELGKGKGYGYAINVPFSPHSDDLIFEQAFNRVVLPLLHSFRPDLLVTQLGVDSLRTDPLTRLECTTGAMEFAARAFFDTGLPWAALGGGGYDKMNVARCWTLIWAIMLNQQVPDEIPASFALQMAAYGINDRLLRDLPHLAQPDDYSRAQQALDKALRVLKRRAFPLHGLFSGEA